MVFQYTACMTDGGRERGIVTADSPDAAEVILRGRGRIILSLKAVDSGVSSSPNYHVRERSPREKTLAKYLIPNAQIEIALGQLASLLDGGVPVLSAIQTVAAQSRYLLSRCLFSVANQVRDGSPLAKTIQEEMPFLGNTITGMISAGEANGDIGRMCSYSADLLSRKRQLKGQILQAMAYPSIVILATGGIVTFMMLQVIPKIMKFLNGRSAQLPPVTQALVDITHFIQTHAMHLFLVPAVLVAAALLIRRNESTAVRFDGFILRIPLLGKIIRSSANMLWCRTLGILLKSGINIITAMDYTAAALNNWFYRSELNEMKDVISQGHPLSTALRVSRLDALVPFADSMLAVGESTGRVDDCLLKVAEFSDKDLQRRITFMSKMIEPVLFFIVGGIVGFVYIAFFMGLMAASTGK